MWGALAIPSSFFLNLIDWFAWQCVLRLGNNLAYFFRLWKSPNLKLQISATLTSILSHMTSTLSQVTSNLSQVTPAWGCEVKFLVLRTYCRPSLDVRLEVCTFQVMASLSKCIWYLEFRLRESSFKIGQKLPKTLPKTFPKSTQNRSKWLLGAYLGPML